MCTIVCLYIQIGNIMHFNTVKTEQIRKVFKEHGISIAEWARKNGFSVPLAYQVLSGQKKCVRGQSHDIAVKLGLKKGNKTDFNSLAQAINNIKSKD